MILEKKLIARNGQLTKPGVLHVHKTLYMVYKYLNLYDDYYENELVKPNQLGTGISSHIQSIIRLCDVILSNLEDKLKEV